MIGNPNLNLHLCPVDPSQMNNAACLVFFGGGYYPVILGTIISQ